MPGRRQIAHWLIFLGFAGGVYNILDGLMRRFYLAPTPKALALAESGTGYLIAGLVGVALSAAALVALRRTRQGVEQTDASKLAYAFGAAAIALAVALQL